MHKKSLIFVVGLKRNGNHAIIGWILEQIKSLNISVGFINDVNEKPLTFNDIENVIEQNTITILSYEEIGVSTFSSIKHKSKLEVDITTLIVLRDVGNSLASRKKYLSNFHSDIINIHDYFMNTDEYLNSWKKYAKLFIVDQDDFTIVNYNKFVSSKPYRDLLMKNIFGIRNRDLGRNKIMNHGDGSSFDGLIYDGNARGMKLFDRWKTLSDDLEFKEKVLEDSSLLELNNKIFSIKYL